MKTLYDLKHAPPSPTPVVRDPENNEVSFATLWEHRDLTAFFFTRHFG